MVERTAVGSSARQSTSLPAPASRLVAKRAPYVRDSLVLAALGVGGSGMASIVSQPQWFIPSVTAGVAGGVAVLVEGRLRQLRQAERDRLVESLAPLLSAPRVLMLDRRMVHTQTLNWTSSWPGVPRRIRLRYSPGAASDDPQWLPKILGVVEQRLLRNYEVVTHDRRRCRIVLALASHGVESTTAASAVRERVERTVAELIGPTAVVTGIDLAGEELTRIGVRHKAGTRLASSGYRARIERTISTVLQGRWRAAWDLEHDEVVFSTRREFPTTVWLEPVDVDAQADILSTYDDVAIPHSVDEDGVEQLWRPAHDPNLLVVGAPGTGKALALDTPIPTPSGWTTMGALEVGDIVFDERGTRCSVVMAHPVRHDRLCYRVTFSGGSTIVADAEHVWQTSTKAERTAQGRRSQIPCTRLNSHQMQALRYAMAASRPRDVISVPELASLVGVAPTSRTLYALIAALPVVTRTATTEVWREHDPLATVHTQRVNIFDRREILAATASSPFWLDRTGMSAEQLRALGEQEPVGATVTSVELRALLGGWSVNEMTTFMAAHRSVPRSTTVVETPRAMGRRFRPYRPATRMFLKTQAIDAVIAWGESTHSRVLTTSSTRTTEEIRQSLLLPSGHANHSIPVTESLDCPPANLPVDPYVLGVWLGDGTSAAPVVTSADTEIADQLRDCGVEVVELGIGRESSGGLVHTYAVRGIRRQLIEMKLLRGPGERAGNGKHVPSQYLRASTAQRHALLAGLLDTDGTVSPQGQVQFTSCTLELAEGARELACSLGFRATICEGRARLEGRDCGPKWTISWTTDRPVFRLKRKRASQAERTANLNASRNSRRYIVNVEPVESVPVRCITVDSRNSLYLAGESFIPTHNTSLEHCILASIARYGWPIWVVDGKGIEFLGFRGWPNVQVVATRIEEQIAVLERAWEVMEYRYQLIVTGRARKSDFEPLMVFLDEFADFRSNLLDWYLTVKRDKAEKGAKKDPTVPPVLAKIASIARKGRSSRVHLLFATQRPDATYFGGGTSGGGDMRDNFRCRISMGRLSIQGAMMMWQDPTVGVTIPRGKRGRATTIDEDNRPVEIQGYRCPDPHDDTITPDQQQLLERLRPVEVRHDRLLIRLPRPVLDPETQELMQPSYRDYAAAEWVRAAEHPELDPEASTAISPEEARLLASPMTVFGLTDAQRPARSFVEPASDAPIRATAGQEQTDDDLYGPYVDVRPDLDEIRIGDLLLVDEDDDQWAVVDGEAGEDPADPTSWAIPWRDDADECGLLSVPDGERVTIRHSLERST